MTNRYCSNMTPLIEKQILSDHDLSSHHVSTLNKVKEYFDERLRPVTWDDVFVAINEKYTDITSTNAVRRNEDFTGLATKCKENYKAAMEVYVSESVNSEVLMKEKHQSEMEKSLHLFHREASTKDLNRIKITGDLISQYRRAMAARSQQILTDKILLGFHEKEKKEAIDQFLSDAFVEWLPSPTPDPEFLSHKLDSEYQTIKSANSNTRDQVYSSLVEKWIAVYDQKMKASMEACILRNNEFNEEHEKNYSAIKASFSKEAPTDGPCYNEWVQTLQTKVSEKRQDLFLQNSRKQKEMIWALIDQHCKNFNRNLRGNLKEQAPEDVYYEEVIRSERQNEIERFRENAPAYVEPLAGWTQTIINKIDNVAETVRTEINSRKKEQKATEICRTTLEEAFQQISKDLDKEFGPGTPHASQKCITEFATKLKKHIKGWYVVRNQSCPSHWLEEIDQHVERKEAEYIRLKSKQTIEVRMTDDHKKKLSKLSSELVEKMEIDDTFIAALISNDVISREWAKDLGNRMRSQSDRTLEFLGRLEKRSDSAYEGFMRALKHSGQEHLALQLL